MRFDDSFIDRVLAASDILEEFRLIGVEAKKAGKGEHEAHCPWHNGESTALKINAEKNLFNCFSCGVSGNTFTLLMQKGGKNFREAVEYVARKSGIEIPKDADYNEAAAKQRQTEMNRLAEMNQAALLFFQSQLTGAPLDYLVSSRGVKQQAIDAFHLGYGGDETTGLFNQLKAGYLPEEIIKAGLAATNESGQVFDVFRGRIVFPIFDRSGRVSGFSGRAMEGTKSRAKYLNTKDTPLFHKDGLLYGFHENQAAIRDAKIAVLVEGYMDVIGLNQAGLHYAVAPMGTAVSAYHVQMLKRSGVERVFILFDPDQAGMKGAFKAAEALAGIIPAVVCNLPAGKDPDEIANESPAAITKILDAGKDPLEAFGSVLLAGFDLISREPSEVVKEKMLTRLSGIHGVSPAAIKADYLAKYTKKDIEAPQVEENDYSGRVEWPVYGNVLIVVNKGFQMFIKKEFKDADGKVVDSKCEAIQSTHAILPKYKVKIEDEVNFIVECRKAGEKPVLVTIPESKFGEPVKLQNALTQAGIPVHIGRTRMPLHSFISKYSAEVKPANVGVNYTEGGSYICGYDYIFKDGRYYPADDNIVRISEKEIFYITGYNLKRVNESSLVELYSRAAIEPEGKIQEYIRKADKLFKTKEKGRISLAFLATAMLREKLVKRLEEVPSLNFYGETPSVGKTTFLDAISAITNTEKHRAKITEHQLYKLQENRVNGVILMDDMQHVEGYIGFLKDAASNSYRPRRDAVDGKLNNPQIRNSVFMTTNHSISMSNESDTEALESRVINIRFDKEDQLYNHKAYKEFKRFVKSNAFDIYIDMYSRISAIDIESLETRIDEIEDEIVKLELKSSRIIKLWSILLACGEAVGIRMSPKQYLDFIERAEGEKMNKSDFYAAALLETVTAIEKEAHPEVQFRTKDYTETERLECKERNLVKASDGTVLFVPPVFMRSQFLKLDDLTGHFRNYQLTKDFSQEFLLKELYNLTWITKHKIVTRTQFIKGEKRERTGTYLEINFAHDIFKKAVALDGKFAFLRCPDNLNMIDDPVPDDIRKAANNASF